ncbi:hypothetical protein PVL29_007513 [Vitis rotundifolia]|uniref:Uncharacterized protein n=1 Tax=Vitis rotundifolia TaxID=103349 RepID=A0AA39A0F3_VITRO|nr:hypothetical protein PVL29_007513 [Vitis rotundifolia]
MDDKWKASKKEGSSSRSSASSNAPLMRSCSQKTTCSKSPLMRSFSQKSSSISRKCSNLAKEQKAKFYIIKRCVSMLVSSNKHGDS